MKKSVVPLFLVFILLATALAIYEVIVVSYKLKPRLSEYREWRDINVVEARKLGLPISSEYFYIQSYKIREFRSANWINIKTVRDTLSSDTILLAPHGSKIPQGYHPWSAT